MSSFNRDTLFEYRCGLGNPQARKIQPTESSIKSCLDSGAASSFFCLLSGNIAQTSGGSSE